MLVEYTRVVAECDGCGASEGPGPDRVEWFDSFDLARDELADRGWTGLDPDARRMLCPVCTGLDACTERGHAYSDWTAGGHMTRGNDAARAAGHVPELRDCGRCGLVEFRTRLDDHRTARDAATDRAGAAGVGVRVGVAS